MKPFRFTLEALQTLRQQQEQTALENHARALMARQQALEIVDKLNRELTAARLAWQQRAGAGCPAAQLAQEQMHCLWLDERCREAGLKLTEAERNVQRAFNAVVQARRERELIDRIRNRQRIAFDAAIARAEQKELDDLVNGRFALAGMSLLAN